MTVTGRAAPMSWLRAVGLSTLAALAAVPVGFVLIYVVVVATLCLVYVGLWLVPSAAAAIRVTSGWYATLAERGLGRQVQRSYAPVTGWPGWQRTRSCLADEQRQRDLGWLVIFAVVLWVPVVVAGAGWALGIAAWPVSVTNWGASHLLGLALMLACWGVWTLSAVLLTAIWMRVTVAVLGDREAALAAQLARERAQRAEQIDHTATELQRLERDLHDGAQARLAALGMTLGLAADVVDRDPGQARALIEEASQTAGRALDDLRTVVRGIRPPVLADRGLAGAVQALALDLPMRVEVESRLTGRLPQAVESALYFAAAELLANAVKHARCTTAWVTLAHTEGSAALIVGDDGVGGAGAESGGGLAGVARRVAGMDGSLTIDSPPGGPTEIRVEVPCAYSSARTTPSSATDSSES